ncbi:MAG: hypothetical protein COU08_04525 [Candidatus Harrisonbacteria bacterium CG10_big_fil_rev_8_21_14_0_10_42_17]|uniref:Type II secretion system protein GspF domain-containing protein n=1 Tax=Candidatus Harrisonbacteria bacterium CG10_big_fil_rev_8_21_14_0_10_42_17 TaxID=1974584 RepID=A0A2M6WH21_9BACT|nr:MAG: hypothetical protein COU08_04525 [Candidatus Harrisonbacteria bacterium CG10_big_fil_rev_8_21_14_0_10_42_17]
MNNPVSNQGNNQVKPSAPPQEGVLPQQAPEQTPPRNVSAQAPPQEKLLRPEEILSQETTTSETKPQERPSEKLEIKQTWKKPLFLNVSLQEKILFSKHMAIAIKSGMSLIDSIRLIEKQTKSKSLKKILNDVSENLTRGVFLSTVLEKYENVFGNLFINIIKIAEASGTLPENLNYLASELKKKHDLRKKIRGAMVYPIIILIMTIIIVTVMVLFVFPKIFPLFESLDVELPLTTKLLLAFSNFIRDYGFWAAGGVVVFVIGVRTLFRVKSVRYVYHRFLIGVPLFHRAVIAFNMANMTRTMALLLRSGVHIVDATKISANSLTNLVYQRELNEAADQIRQGIYFSKHLSEKPRIFPQIAANMIAIGENTGNLTDNLFYLAEFYEADLDDFVKNLSSILEPILLLFMGVIVGFIALSFITPLYQITKGF